MKTSLFVILVAACFSGCTSKPVKATKEIRGNPSSEVAYAGFINQRTQQLQQMGGPFKDRAVAQQKAIEEADSRFASDSGDSVTTTWSTGKDAGKAQAQEEFTDKLDDMARQKKAQ